MNLIVIFISEINLIKIYIELLMKSILLFHTFQTKIFLRLIWTSFETLNECSILQTVLFNIKLFSLGSSIFGVENYICFKDISTKEITAQLLLSNLIIWNEFCFLLFVKLFFHLFYVMHCASFFLLSSSKCCCIERYTNWDEFKVA